MGQIFPKDVTNANLPLIERIHKAKFPLCCECVPRKRLVNGNVRWRVIQGEEQYIMCRVAGHALWLPFGKKEWWRSTSPMNLYGQKWEWGKGGSYYD